MYREHRPRLLGEQQKQPWLHGTGSPIPTARTRPRPPPRSTYHLVQGVAQQPVLVEDEEAALPFLKEKTRRQVTGHSSAQRPPGLTGDARAASTKPVMRKGTEGTGDNRQCAQVSPSTGIQLPKMQGGPPQQCRDHS